MTGDPTQDKKMEGEKPFLSIIITAFNNEPVVGSALKSALQQTLASIEIIVIDDGSTDKTSMVIRNIDPGGKKVRYHYQQNSGIAAARNQAMTLVSGIFFAFLDADDTLSPDFAETLHQRFLESVLPPDLFILDFYEERKKGGLTPVHFDTQLLRYYEKEPSDAALLIADRFASVWAKAYRTGFVSEHQLRFHPSKTLEDMFFILDLLACRPVICHVPVYAYYYLYNPDSLSRNLDLATFQNRENAVRHYLLKYKSFREADYFISFFSNRIFMQFVLSFSGNVVKDQRRAVFYRTMQYLQEAVETLKTATGYTSVFSRIKLKKTKSVFLLFCLIKPVYRLSRPVSYFMIRMVGMVYRYRK